MAVRKIPFVVNVRRNNNMNSSTYGCNYPVADMKKTLRGLRQELKGERQELRGLKRSLSNCSGVKLS